MEDCTNLHMYIRRPGLVAQADFVLVVRVGTQHVGQLGLVLGVG